MPDAEKQLYQDIGSLKTETAANTKAIADLSNKIEKSFDTVRAEIRNIGAVSRTDWEKRNTYVDSRLENHETRLESIENRHEMADASLWKRIAKKAESNLINWIGAGILFLLVAAIIYLVKQDVTFQSLPTDITVQK